MTRAKPTSSSERRHCGGPVARRELLKLGALAVGGLSLPQILQAREASGNASADTSVILLYMHGGPSQLETYDLKPDAPSGYRSIYRPIPTVVPGMDVCEHLPLHAKLADKFSLVRSLNHDVGIHSDGGIVVLTGKRPSKLDPTSQSKSEHPDIGHIVSRVRGLNADAIPPYVAIPQKPYMTLPTYLGSHHAAFETGEPSNPNYAPPQMSVVAGRDPRWIDDRRTLLRHFDRLRADVDQNGTMGTGDRFRDLAFQMLTSTKVADAFDVRKEDPRVRERYGDNFFGQGCLLARRLAEAGAGIINVYINTPKSGLDFTNWDDHILNAGRPGHFGIYMTPRLAFYDQAVSALIEDIYARGIDRRVLVVAVGEFGRTPRISQNASGAGRDHWPQAYTALVAGGGLRCGQTVGATNSKSEYPTEKPYTPQDLLAVMYRHLRIDPHQPFNDFGGRPIAILQEGRPIPELDFA
ncbi:MAG: DUF1501 domain-containing protein [Planctomycetaceae bacterium]|nr:DUF1501 domain-containing protein [Planctomycetaceae bacterium]